MKINIVLIVFFIITAIIAVLIAVFDYLIIAGASKKSTKHKDTNTNKFCIILEDDCKDTELDCRECEEFVQYCNKEDN